MVLALLGIGVAPLFAQDWRDRLRDLGHPEFEVRSEAKRWFESSPPLADADLPELVRLAGAASLETRRHAAEVLARHPHGLSAIVPVLSADDLSTRQLAEWVATRVFEESFPRWDPETTFAWRPRFRDARLPWRLPQPLTFRDLADAVQASGGSLIPILDPTLPRAFSSLEVQFEIEADAFPSPIDALLRETLQQNGLDDIACEPFLAMTVPERRSPDGGARLFVDLLIAVESPDADQRRAAAWDVGALGLSVLHRFFCARIASRVEAESEVGLWGLAGSGSRPTRIEEPALVGQLIDALETPDERLRRGIELLLAVAEPPVLRQLLTPSFAAASPGARASRLRLLGKVGTSAELPFLRKEIAAVLKSGAVLPGVIAARGAIDHPMDELDLELLVPALAREDRLGTAAAKALARGMVEGGLEWIAPLLESTSASVRRRAAIALGGVAVMDLTPTLELVSTVMARETDPSVCLALGRMLGDRYSQSEPEAQKRLNRAIRVLTGLGDREAAIRLRALGAALPESVFESEVRASLRASLGRGTSSDPLRWVAAVLLQERPTSEQPVDVVEQREVLGALRRAFESADEPFASWAAAALAETWRPDVASREFGIALERGFERGEETLQQLGRHGWRALARRLAREGADDDLRRLRDRLIRLAHSASGGFGEVLDSIRAEVDRVAWEARLYRSDVLDGESNERWR